MIRMKMNRQGAENARVLDSHFHNLAFLASWQLGALRFFA